MGGEDIPSIVLQANKVRHLREVYHLAANKLHRLRDIEKIKKKQVKTRTTSYDINQILIQNQQLRESHQRLENQLTLFKQLYKMLVDKIQILEKKDKKQE